MCGFDPRLKHQLNQLTVISNFTAVCCYSFWKCVYRLKDCQGIHRGIVIANTMTGMGYINSLVVFYNAIIAVTSLVKPKTKTYKM